MHTDQLEQKIIGAHPSIVQLRQLVQKVALSKASTVLIYGETGTGKGLVARAIHDVSSRSRHEFTDVNCAAIPGNLMESELFGHERGAFTGAVSKKTGLLEIANKGTLFLDEIRELDPTMQAKLLTLLDSRRFRKIGAVTEQSSDVRFLAATNKILLGEVNAGKFRDDLYYRLQVVSINIPPLRERGDDIFVLTDNLLRRFNQTHSSQFSEISPKVADVFSRYTWPGNVRELGNLLERICILETGKTIELEHIPNRIVRASEAKASELISIAGDYFTKTEEFQCELIKAAWTKSNGSMADAAQLLGLSRHALRHQLKKLGIDTPLS